MALTRAAVDLLGEDITHVQLAYNAKTGAVGIRAATEEAPGCYQLRAKRKTPSRLVGGKRFFKHHGLTVDDARTYGVDDFGNGIVGFDSCWPVWPVWPVRTMRPRSRPRPRSTPQPRLRRSRRRPPAAASSKRPQ